MTITLKFFARFRDIVGAAERALNVDNSITVAEVIQQLERDYPRFDGQLRRIALTAVNERYVPRETPLQPNDVLALFPPVSGG